VWRLVPAGELDLATTPRLESEIETATAGEIEHLVIDLSEISFIDSTGLSMFLVLQARSASHGWELTLTRPSEAVRSILQITGSEQALPVVDDWRPPS
jgi:anti-sigma B factor antagonist